MTKPKKPTVRDCAGCHNDFYNGHNDLGVSRCWSLESAEFVKRIEVHVDQRPPYHQKPIKVPSCFKRPRHVYVKPESLDSKGFWR